MILVDTSVWIDFNYPIFEKKIRDLVTQSLTAINKIQRQKSNLGNLQTAFDRLLP